MEYLFVKDSQSRPTSSWRTRDSDLHRHLFDLFVKPSESIRNQRNWPFTVIIVEGTSSDTYHIQPCTVREFENRVPACKLFSSEIIITPEHVTFDKIIEFMWRFGLPRQPDRSGVSSLLSIWISEPGWDGHTDDTLPKFVVYFLTYLTGNPKEGGVSRTMKPKFR